MLFKSIPLPLLIVLLFAAACNNEPQDEPQPSATTTEPPPGDCACEKLLLGYFEMEDCQVYLSSLLGVPPFSCVGGKLEVSTNFGQGRVTFRSKVWTFCERPVKLWVWGGQTISPLSGLACDAYFFDTSLGLDGHELDLQLDEEFLPCAFDEEEGFWFALPIQ